MKINKKYLLMGVLLFLFSFSLFSQGKYLEINLNETRNTNPFARPRSPLEVFRVIEKAANDDKVQGIILNIASINRSRDHLWELRDALENFKSGGKKIIAFISFADMDIYNLASVADKIVMDELGILTMLGYSVNRGYVQRTLEKLGIGVRELRYFEYKSGAEMFSRDSMSEAERRQNNDYLDDIFNLTRDTLMNARNWTDNEFNNILNSEFIYSARSALNRNIVDYTGRQAAVLNAIKDIEGVEITNFVLYGDSVSSITGAKVNYAPPGAGGIFRRPPVIAVVYANGQTDMNMGMSALNLSRTIRELADNNRVRAIVIRINSPGGSAEAADYMDEAVRYAKQKKPVVVSMGQVAASGGYWAAMNASHIVANPYTVTGSIGVIGSWFYDNGLNNRLGLTMDSIQRGNSADLMKGFLLPYRNLTVLEEDRYSILLRDIYSIFTGKVAAGRSLDIEAVESVAQGRIFSGIRAQEAGLIDSVGGISDALRIARNLAGIPENKNVRYDEYPKQTFMERFTNNIPVISMLFRNRNQNNTINFFMNILIPDDINYRLERNGQIMPILPLGFNF
jgi:protease-4